LSIGGITNGGKIAQDKSPAIDNVKCYEFMIYYAQTPTVVEDVIKLCILVKWDGNPFRSPEIENHKIFYFYFILLQLYYYTVRLLNAGRRRPLKCWPLFGSREVSAIQLLVCYPKNSRCIEVSVRRGFTVYDLMYILYLIGTMHLSHKWDKVH